MPSKSAGAVVVVLKEPMVSDQTQKGYEYTRVQLDTLYILRGCTHHPISAEDPFYGPMSKMSHVRAVLHAYSVAGHVCRVSIGSYRIAVSDFIGIGMCHDYYPMIITPSCPLF